MMTTSARSPRQRGFTLIEIMLVVAIIGIISTLAIPGYQRMSARARKAELHTVLGKFVQGFRNNYDTTGVYGPPMDSAWNPPENPGPSAEWKPTLKGWQDIPFPPEGGLHLRYHYNISADGKTLTLDVKGSFVGIPGWTYTQTYSSGAAPADPVEMPIKL
jgi:prepilin-type N-terminal cleavage/methylation domain-containing protein